MASTLAQTNQSDELLAAAVARRQDSDRALRAARESFEQLYRHHAPSLQAFIAARVRPENRDDLHQEVWRRAWQHLPDQFHGGNIRAWLYEIARHVIIDEGRKRKAESLADPEVLVDGRRSRGGPMPGRERAKRGTESLSRPARAEGRSVGPRAAGRRRLPRIVPAAGPDARASLQALPPGQGPAQNLRREGPGMKLIALEIPEDQAATTGWLERQLLGLDLAALVAELEAAHGPADQALSLERLLGERRDAILARGLEALPPDRLRQLLLRPRLLLDLQEMIVVSGGPFWQKLAASAAMGPEQRLALDRSWSAIVPALTGEVNSATPERVGSAAPRRSVLKFPWRGLISLAAAAAILLGVFIVVRGPGGGGRQPQVGLAARSGWGWNRPDALPQNLPAGAYLTHLADAAQEWFNKRPDDSLELSRRIAEFRQGCSVLILSPHRSLSAEDRIWLVEKCRAWAAKLDAHLAAVEAGQDSLKVRGEADETINKLIAALRERARKSA